MILLLLAEIVAVIFVGLLVWDILARFHPGYNACSKINSLTRYPIIGNFAEVFVLNPETTIPYLDRKTKENKHKLFGHWTPLGLGLNIARAEDAEVMLSSSKHITKSLIYDFLHPFLKTGLLTSKGKKWVERRKILTPAFHFNILQQFYATFKEQSDICLKNIDNESTSGDCVKIHDIISTFTLNSISETAMGYKQESSQASDDYRKKLHLIGEMIILRITRPWLISNFNYKILGYYRKMMNHIVPVHKYTSNFINKRRQDFNNKSEKMQQLNENIYESTKVRYAMLDTLLAAEYEGKIDKAGIQEEVDTFTFEGHDTTATGIIFTLFLLAQHPEAQERIFNELNDLLNDRNINEITVTELSNLNYLDRVIKESLRLYPPVMFISRETSEPVVIDGCEFPQNTLVNFHIFHLHRDPVYFPDPEKFDPDRFLPENSIGRHPYAYIPFSAGPRNCIGQKYANLEIKTLITRIILKYILKPVTRKEDLVLLVNLVLRSKYPIKIKFELR